MATMPVFDPDPLYDAALAHVRETKRASISGVQRHLSIGYNRAAWLLDRMEKEGVITYPDSHGRREVKR